jgi:hypothetical protein
MTCVPLILHYPPTLHLLTLTLPPATLPPERAAGRDTVRPRGRWRRGLFSSSRWRARTGATTQARRHGSLRRDVFRGSERWIPRIRRCCGWICGPHRGGTSFGWRPDPGGSDGAPDGVVAARSARAITGLRPATRTPWWWLDDRR